MKPFKKVLIAVLIIVVSILAIYGTLKILIYKNVLQDDIFSKILSYWWIPVILAVVIVIIYWIYGYLKNRKKEEIKTPKEIVDVEPLLEIFQEEFIKGTGIPYLVEIKGKDKYSIKPLNENSVRIRNTQSFPHPKTGNPLLSFEILALEGTHYGVNICVLRLDLGLEWVRNNWRSIMKMNTTEETFDFGSKERPLDVPESDKLRIALYEGQKREEGYTNEELSHLKDFIPNNKDSKEEKIDDEGG